MAVSANARPVSLVTDEKARSPLAEAWILFKRNRPAVICLIIVIALFILALTAPLWRNLGLIDDPADQHHTSSLANTMTCATDNAPGKPEFCFILGSDNLGRDVLSRVVFGTQVSLMVGVVGTTVSMVVGTLYGLVSGYYGGWVDNLLMRIVDFLYGLPDLVLIILMQVYFKTLAEYAKGAGPAQGISAVGVALVNLNTQTGGLLFIFIAIGLLSWIGVARLTRGQVLQIKEKEYVEAARAVGASNRRIIFVHLLPNVIGPLIIIAALSIPGFIFTEAVLSVLGLGVNPPTPSWGAMIQDAVDVTGYYSQPFLILAPGGALALTTLAFTFLGDGLRDALDPRQRGTR